MTLKTYNHKRNFKVTSEPTGKAPTKKKKSKLLYIIQKHAASHLHYDFRLELDGVLLSWAIPKGPCLDSTVKRLAMHVEDHPIEYGSFEGIIPKGEYGGGTVMLWDRGEWVAEDDNPVVAYKKGDMKFSLQGEKLKGKWKLIRINHDDKTWLLMKAKDEYAKPLTTYDVTLKLPNSVLSQKTLDELTEGYQFENIKKTSHKTASQKILKTSVKLTNPGKILYPEDGFTKSHIADYYEEVSRWILPYISNRPLTLVRCPEGYHKCFYQKHITNTVPDAIHGITIKEKEGKSQCIYINDVNGLMSLSQLSVLEIHPWGSRIDNIEFPDTLIFDIDPSPEIPWKKVVAAAQKIRAHLAEFKLLSFVKTTGGKGLHVVMHIKPEHGWEDIKLFSRKFVDFLVMQNPKLYVSNMSKAQRKGKIFIDYLRNQRGATAVAPYSTRARVHAPVSTPVGWDELTSQMEDTYFTMETLPERLRNLKEDPWKQFYKKPQRLNLDKHNK